MFHVFRRIGFFRRRWVWALLLIGAAVFAGYWVVPWGGSAADLQLLVLRADGTFSESVRASTLRAADDSSTATTRDPRGVPLVLGVANHGMRAGRAERLVLALPRWYRLTGPAGVVRNEVLPDETLQRYIVELDTQSIQSARVPTVLPNVDTLWLEPFVPDYWCTADDDSVPQLIASTPPDTSGVVPVQVFWSFEGGELDRQTGLLTIELPGEMYRRDAPIDIAQSPVTVQLPFAPRPEMGVLVEGGTRYADCGPPGDPMRIFSALWITPAGGRMISIHYGGLPRKEYYDLNRDSVFELEMWDPDGDGDMEAYRTVRVAIPDYMMPQDPITAADSAAAAVAAADSAAAAALATATVGDTLAPVAGAPPRAGIAIDLATISRMFVPGDVTRARRLFVREPRPAPPVRRDDGPIGTPVGPEPERPEPAPEPVGETPQPAEPEPQPSEPVEEPAEEPADDEEQPDLIDRVLQEAAEQDAQDDEE